MKQDKQDVVQRVRIGLTGLACVFLLVLLSAILVKSIGNGGEPEEVPSLSASAPVDPVTNAAREGPRDPLAELGVAPGNMPSKAGKAETAPPEVLTLPPEQDLQN